MEKFSKIMSCRKAWPTVDGWLHGAIKFSTFYRGTFLGNDGRYHYRGHYDFTFDAVK